MSNPKAFANLYKAIFKGIAHGSDEIAEFLSKNGDDLADALRKGNADEFLEKSAAGRNALKNPVFRRAMKNISKNTAYLDEVADGLAAGKNIKSGELLSKLGIDAGSDAGKLISQNIVEFNEAATRNIDTIGRNAEKIKEARRVAREGAEQGSKKSAKEGAEQAGKKSVAEGAEQGSKHGDDAAKMQDEINNLKKTVEQQGKVIEKQGKKLATHSKYNKVRFAMTGMAMMPVAALLTEYISGGAVSSGAASMAHKLEEFLRPRWPDLADLVEEKGLKAVEEISEFTSTQRNAVVNFFSKSLRLNGQDEAADMLDISNTAFSASTLAKAAKISTDDKITDKGSAVIKYIAEESGIEEEKIVKYLEEAPMFISSLPENIRADLYEKYPNLKEKFANVELPDAEDVTPEQLEQEMQEIIQSSADKAKAEIEKQKEKLNETLEETRDTAQKQLDDVQNIDALSGQKLSGLFNRVDDLVDNKQLDLGEDAGKFKNYSKLAGLFNTIGGFLSFIPGVGDFVKNIGEYFQKQALDIAKGAITQGGDRFNLTKDIKPQNVLTV